MSIVKQIPIGSDHAGYPAKEQVKKILERLGYTPVDYGTDSEESVDYPDYSKPVAAAIDKQEYPRGILLCGSGQGACMTANKFPGVRAGIAWNPEVAALTVQHNNANILCLPGRMLDEASLAATVEAWLNAAFEGGRHQRRVDKISK